MVQRSNYFVYPYVEVDGKPYDKLDKQFNFEEVNPRSEGAKFEARRASPW
jgi:hypothetical protein